MGRRFGELEAQEKSFAHAEMEVAPGSGSPVTATQENFTQNLKFLPTPPKLWAGRREPLSFDESKMRRRKLGGLCWVTAVSRPDICARLPKIGSRINSQWE